MGGNDFTMTDQLTSRIQRHINGRARLLDFRVEVRGQGLVLQGIAFSYYAKQIAHQAAMEVSGLQILANDIEIQ